MNKIVGIQFRENGKVYDFDSGHFVLGKGDKVMVVTDEGPAIGRVFAEPQARPEKGPRRKLKKIFRLATEEEVKRFDSGCSLEESVYAYCYQRVKERRIPMSLVSVERRFDGSKIIVYFTADGRVDFRELVKDLVGKFKTRIEMRQIGVRHQAKMVGGMGSCGRVQCCASFLNNFDPVTIKMAKSQNISLNPSKISGMCGRLMCCLTFEHDYYDRAKKRLPKVGKRVKTGEGEGKIIRQNVLRESLTVALDSGAEIEVHVKELDQTTGGEKPAGARKRKSRKRSNH
jgi:cell fate regulator YaaT (PSP1 superfamily)